MGSHDGHRKRMREKFLNGGIEAMAPHEILEFVLYGSVPQKNTNELGHALIKEFESVAGVLEAPYEQLLKVDGVGPVIATNIKFQLEFIKMYLAGTRGNIKILNSTTKIVDFLQSRYLAYRNEVTSVICLDSKFNLLGFDKLAEGDIGSVGFSTRRVMEFVIKYNASAVVIAHNHPGGTAIPSPADAVATGQLVEVLNTVSAQLIDHIIVSDDGCVSMRSSEKFQYLF
ncbi:MAG: DNA repair protein RadC [Oscillospiraceae bacterium]